jgi:hypothetical protein
MPTCDVNTVERTFFSKSMASVISPYPMRSTISQEAGALRISIPMRKKPFLILFLLVWLGAWTVAGISTGRQLLHQFVPFNGFWMCGWALGEVMVTYVLVRMLGGRDIVQVANGIVEIRKEAFGLGFSKQYSPQEIRDLRFLPEAGSGRGHSESSIAFDYGAKTIKFGDGIDESEAKQLIGRIRDGCGLTQEQICESASPRFWQGK